MTVSPGNSGSSALANLTAGTAGAVAPGQGPSASSALGNNFLAGGKMPMVYWGPSNVIHANSSGRDSSSQEEGDKRLGITQNRPGDNTKTLPEAVSDWYTWSDQERSSFGQRLYKLGLIADPNDYHQAYSMWANAVQEASNFYTATDGVKKITPWQAVDLMAGTSGGPKPTTHVEKNFSIPTVEDAHAATKSIFQALMGRDPNGDELDRYASMMTAYAQKHPRITKVVTDIHGNNTTTNSGGVSEAAMGDVLSNQAKADPEYGAYQAATTYWNALVNAIGGTGHGG